MLLTIPGGVYLNRFSYEDSLDMISRSGYDAIDFTFFKEEWFNEETDSPAFREKMYTYKQKALEKGLVYSQAHAPFPEEEFDMQYVEDNFMNVVRSMRNASYLGIGIIVVHPQMFLDYCEEGAPEKLFEYNMNFYRKLIPYCEEYNIKVAIENLWQVGKHEEVQHAPCSRVEEQIRYVDELGSEWMVACLDMAHAHMVAENPATVIRKLGNKRLQAVHVHDCNGLVDQHTIPYGGTIDWADVAKALSEIGYTGNFTLEATNFLKQYPMDKELWIKAGTHLADVSRYIMSLISV